MIRLLISGGSDAGISAALRAKEVEPSTEATVLVANSFPNYSIFSLPFFLSGEVPDWHQLAHRSIEEIRREGINLLLKYKAQLIHPIDKSVSAVDKHGKAFQFKYDRLIIATGAVPIRPFIQGIDLPGVHFLRSMEDIFAIQYHLTTYNPKSVVIVGAGYVGLEMADALTFRGLDVTVIEHSDFILKTMNPSLGQLIEGEIQHQVVKIYTGVGIQSISVKGKQLVQDGCLKGGAGSLSLNLEVANRPPLSNILVEDSKT